METLVKIQEVARVLGKSVKTIRRRVDKGLIPAIQEGGKGTDLRFDLDEVIEAVKNPLPATTTTPPIASVPSQNSTESNTNKRSGPTPKWKQLLNKTRRVNE